MQSGQSWSPKSFEFLQYLKQCYRYLNEVTGNMKYFILSLILTFKHLQEICLYVSIKLKKKGKTSLISFDVSSGNKSQTIIQRGDIGVMKKIW